ncbi:MAG: LamG domain-containing protein [Planctomycetes bacterium]|nr:LamG domain-containing protein [Planctomycetota bacterium]
MGSRLFRLFLVVLTVGLVGVGAVSGLAEAVAAGDGGARVLDTDPNLAGWWQFDEVSGIAAADSSGYGRDGVLKGGLSFDKGSVAGRAGGALLLDGKDDLVEITGYKGVGGSAARTIAAWIKTKSSSGEIVSWGTDDFGQMWTMTFIRRYMGVTPNGGYFYMKDAISDEQWHHVAAVVAEAEWPNLHDDVTLYKDGVIAEIHDIGLLDLWPIVTGSDLDVRIGMGLRGAIDDIRIYDRALTKEEVLALTSEKYISN